MEAVSGQITRSDQRSYIEYLCGKNATEIHNNLREVCGDNVAQYHGGLLVSMKVG